MDPVALEDRNKRLVFGAFMSLVGLVVGIMITYGILTVSGFSSVTVVCEINGSATVQKTTQFGGAIVLVIGIFIGPVLVLLFDKLKHEYELRNEGRY